VFRAAVAVFVTALACPAVGDEPKCRGTKEPYKGKCLYPDEVRKLKDKERAEKKKRKVREEKRREEKEKRNRREEKKRKFTKKKKLAEDTVSADSSAVGFDELMGKGDKKRKGGRCPEALGYYLQALRLKPGYSEANYKVADCYRREGDCGRAIEYYKKAVSRSGFRNAYVGLARCYRSLGKTSEARKVLEDGLQRYDDGMMKMMLQELGG